MKNFLFLYMLEKVPLFTQCRVLSAGLDSNIQDLIFNMKSQI